MSSVTVDDPTMELFDGSDWRTYTNAPGGWFGGTYHESCDDRDDLTITFKGTGIRVYGAKRPTYGYYYAELDGENRKFFNAHSPTDEIPALLFEASGLENIDHSLWMMNQQNYGGQRSRSCWGIDYMVVQQAGNASSVSDATPTEQPAPSSAEGGAILSAPPSLTDQSASASFDTTVGNPASSSSSAEGLTVPNLSNYTAPPSADEVNAPNTTWTSGTLTVATGQTGVFTGQPLPVYTGQPVSLVDARPPNLRQEAFVTGIVAGSPSSAHRVELSGPHSLLILLIMLVATMLRLSSF